VSGFTYDHQYWDLPVDGGKYSFVDAANRAGYATLNLDRLGLGSSDKPPAELTSIQNQADELHQIIQSLKSGALSSYGFSEIVLVGHSAGSAIVQTEAGIYNDADAWCSRASGTRSIRPVPVNSSAAFIRPPARPMDT
jgi:alpha-beta hydrolase superfamily lysophospholipase